MLSAQARTHDSQPLVLARHMLQTLGDTLHLRRLDEVEALIARATSTS